MTTVEEWNIRYNNDIRELQDVSKSVNDRIVGIRGGQSRGQYAQLHASNQRKIAELQDEVTRLDEMLNQLSRGMVLPKDIQIYYGKLERFRNQLNDLKSKCSMTEAEIIGGARNDLLSGNVQNFMGETEETRGMTAGELAQTYEMQISRQDSLLDHLHAGLQVQHEKGRGISDELDLQENLIDRVDGKMTSSNQRVKRADSNVQTLLKKNKCNCCLYVIIFLEVVLLIAMVATKNFGMGFWS